MKIFKKLNWQIITMAFIVGLIYVSPHFFLINLAQESGKIYYPTTISGTTNDIMYYSARAKEAYNGKLIAGDVNLAEYNNGPSILPLLNPLLMGWLGKLFGSFKVGLIMSDFIFPFLIFLAIYLLSNSIIKQKNVSLLFSVIFIFSPLAVMQIPPFSIDLLKKLFINLTLFTNTDTILYFSRFDFPKLTYFYYVITLFFTYKALNTENKKYVIFAGIGFGIMFYTYLFDWSSYLVAILIISFFLFFQKEYKQTKKIYQIIIIGIILSIPFWINFITLHNLPAYGDILLRLGVETGRGIRFVSIWKSYLRIILILTALYFTIWKKQRLLFNYLAGLLLSYFVVINMQIITSFNPQPDHWYRTQFLITGISMSVLFYHWGKKMIKKENVLNSLKILSVIYIIFFLTGALYSRYVFSIKKEDHYMIDREYFKCYQWLSENTLKNSVVGTNSFITNAELLVHTNNKIYMPSGYNTLAPTNELWDRAIMMAKLFSMDSEEFISFINKGHNYFFTNYYKSTEIDSYFNNKKKIIPLDEFKQKINFFNSLNNDILDKNVTKHQLDYLLFGPREREFTKEKNIQLSNIKKIYENNKITVFKIL